MDSMEVCCHQEKDRFNKLTSKSIMQAVMSRSLNEIVRAIKGEVLMTPILDEMYNSFLTNAVPLIWKGISYPSLKPLAAWFEDF